MAENQKVALTLHLPVEQKAFLDDIASRLGQSPEFIAEIWLGGMTRSDGMADLIKAIVKCAFARNLAPFGMTLLQRGPKQQ